MIQSKLKEPKQLMKTDHCYDNHKRALSADSSCLPVWIKSERKSRSLCSPRPQRHCYVQFSIPHNTADTLSVAVGAFQAQLEILNNQAAQDRFAGFQQLARKQRLEFCAGRSALGQLGLLQGLAATMQDLQSLLNCNLVTVCTLALCELRWCKP